MGAATETYTKLRGIGRDEQDAYSAGSHGRAAEAQKNGLFDDEIVAVEVPQRRGDPVMVTEDEGVRPDTTAATLAELRPAFAADGTVTAGSSSQISDGAAAVVVMSRAKAEELGAPILAEIGAHGTVAGPDPSLLSQPANAIRKALGRREPHPGPDRPFRDQRGVRRRWPSSRCVSWRSATDVVNVNGGAISMGHPVGASGARHRAAPRTRAQASRRWRRRGRAVRRRRAGRGADHSRSELSDRWVGLARRLVRRASCGTPDPLGELGVAEGVGAGGVDQVDPPVG